MGCDGYIKIVFFGDFPEKGVRVQYITAYEHNWNFEAVHIPPGTRYFKCYHSCVHYQLNTSEEELSENEQ